MRYTRTKNTIVNSVYGLINKTMQTFLPFVLRAVMIRILGSSYLGIDGLFSAILQVLNLTELGFESAVNFSLFKPIAEDDKKTICALLLFYRNVYRLIGLFILIAGGILIPFIPKMIKGSYPSDINIHLIYLVFLFNTVLSYFLFAYKRVLLTAHQKNYLISNIRSILLVFKYGAQILIILLIKNYFIYAIMLPTTTVVENLIIEFYVRKIFPEYVPNGRISTNILIAIKKQVLGLFLEKISATTRNSFDNIFISIFLGLNFVAIYSNYYYIVLGVWGFLDVLCISMSAGIGNSIASETVEKNFEDLKKISFLFALLVTLATCCMLNLYQPFMSLWVGNSFLLSESSMILFVIYFYVLIIGDVSHQYFNGSGLWWFGKTRSILGCISNLLLNWLLIKFIGLSGIILASVISVVFIINIYGWHLLFKHYFINQKKWEYYKILTQNLFVTVCTCGISYYLCSFIHENNILTIIFRFFISCGIAIFIVSLVYSRNLYVREIFTYINKKIIKH